MSRATGICHHIGTFLLFAAAILMLITSISSPVVDDLSILTVKLQNSSDIRFGSWGYCVTGVDSDFNGGSSTYCTGKHIGYKATDEVASADSTTFSGGSADTANALTNAMILHPIVAGMAFIAFLLALGAGFIGAIFSAAVTGVTWVLAVIVMAFDFSIFGYIKHHVNDEENGSSSAHFGPAMWTCMASMICLFLGFFWVLFTCCSKRIHEKRARRHMATKV